MATTLAMPSYVKVSIDGFDIDRATGLNRTPMSDGMIKQSRMFSRVMVTRNCVLLLDSKADYLAFITFYETTLNRGEYWFNWVDPIDSATKLARFVSKLGKETMRQLPSKWQIAVQIETWSDGL